MSADELAIWVPRFVNKLRELPELRDVASDQQNNGQQLHLSIDRDTASRLGVTPQMIDNTLYDAFGQRQVSIMFTQLNQYRVVLEVDPSFRTARGSQRHLHPDRRRPCAAFRVHANARIGDPDRDQSPGAIPGGDRFLQPRAGRLAGNGGPGHR